jgi:hypothetical protein
MGRCWTLQEGALSQTLLFQCSDAAIWRGELDYQTDPKRTVSLYLAARHRSLFSMFDWMENSGLPYTDQFELDGSTTTSLVAKLKERFGWPRSVPQLHLSPGEIYEQRISLVLKSTIKNMLLDTRVVAASARDRHGKAAPEFQMKRLVRTWNALASRATTQERDVPAIFANLLDFNSHNIANPELPEELKMRTILWSLEQLPVSILYNDGPRLAANKQHANRWVPTRRSTCTLSEDCPMKLSTGGIEVKNGKPGSPLLIILRPSLPIHTKSFSIFWTRNNHGVLGSDGLSNAGVILEVTLCSPLDDEMVSGEFEASCLLIEHYNFIPDEQSIRWRGACLQINTLEHTRNSERESTGNFLRQPSFSFLRHIRQFLQKRQTSVGSKNRGKSIHLDTTHRIHAIYDSPIRISISKKPSSSLEHYDYCGPIPGCFTQSQQLPVQEESARTRSNSPYDAREWRSSVEEDIPLLPLSHRERGDRQNAIYNRGGSASQQFSDEQDEDCQCTQQPLVYPASWVLKVESGESIFYKTTLI